MASVGIAQSRQKAGRTSARAVVAGCVGNIIEHIDLGLYGYLAPVMAGTFFPGHDHTAALLGTYGAFALGYVAQPVGGILFGRMGDRLGRRAVLLTTIILVGVLTTCIGILPGYAQVGIAAPALLMLVRLLQGVAHGGEYGGALTYLVEHAGPRRRGLYSGYASMGVFGGLLVGAGMSALVSAVLTDEQMHAWGWRLPFLTALPLAAVGLFLRTGADETPAFLASREAGEAPPASPIRETLRTQWRPLLLFSACAMTNAVLSFVWVAYLPGWLESDGGLSSTAAFASHTVALAVLIPLLAVAGILSDRIGRRPLLLAGCASTIVLVPLSFWVAHGGTFGAALGAQLIYLVPEFCIAVPLAAWLPEMVPTRLRVTATALGFNVPFALFSGTAPLVATALVDWSGTLYAVSAYIGVLAAISFVVVLCGLRETAQDDTLPAVPPESLPDTATARTTTAPAPRVPQEG
ncbi:MFS transporter [Streptomyces sp. NPDC007107]|uniref:MFS transporter n=1 Tax=Streptomyces sp. NPDC007107 TaxID=3156915 RepID=UPI0033F3B871